MIWFLTLKLNSIGLNHKKIQPDIKDQRLKNSFLLKKQININ